MTRSTRIHSTAADILDRLPAPAARTARRAARRVLGRPEPAPFHPETKFPERPVGAKFELTHRCNLLCGFCYTDSPVVTRSRPGELTDDEWAAVVDETLALGVIEAVVSGGEPLFRRELTLSVIERITDEGIAAILNTNGWFVDDRVADRLAACDDLTVVVSVDGATPALHDHTRGVAGSWRRAVEALDRLISRGVQVRVNHVVTPDNVTTLGPFMEAMWRLGVRNLRVTPVGPTGAAARGGDWGVDRRSMTRTVGEFCRSHVPSRNVRLVGPATMVDRVRNAPKTLLVKPDGAVLVESAMPFSFGSATLDGVAACWDNMRRHWDDPRVLAWAERVRSDPANAHVPYRDGDVVLAGHAADRARGAAPGVDDVPVAPQGPAPPVGAHHLSEAIAAIDDLVLDRRHAVAEHRWSGDREGDRFVRLPDGHRVAMNRLAGAVMDAADGATVREVLDEVAAATPGVDRERLRSDVVTTVNDLRESGILVPEPVPRLRTPARRRIPVAPR